ncbi:MAG: hypothetical protein HKO95_04000 [Rhodobacteraceae bacterium]|nr:outer membrane protein transport protein [Alphaproteobacteria bacterium]NNF72584.1 hypothetical protein [Paracoccaceae bacterium]NNK65880.1 hypothetical protein [Paracoccaceae bacterium]
MHKHLQNGTALALVLGLLAGPALATNGYFTNGYDPQSKALAGAAVAVPQGVLGIAVNPALGTQFGNQADGCLSLFSPERSTTFGATFESENTLFPIPCLGSTYALSNGRSVGITIFGNGGLNTEYTTNFFGGPAPLGVNLEQLFVSVHYAAEVSDGLSLGIAPVFAFQRFEATGLQPFAGFSGDPTKLTNNGTSNSTGFGANLGLYWEPNDVWAFGAAYRTEMQMSEFDEYAGLFAENGDFDIPATLTLGAAYNATPDLTLTAEYQRIYYGDIAAIANPFAAAAPLGAADGPGFGWKDMDVYRLAAVYDLDDKWTLRGGVSKATEFTDASEILFNTLAPATPEWHISVGATYQVNENWSISGSYVRVLENDLTGTAPPPFPAAPVTIRMDQNELTLGASYTW